MCDALAILEWTNKLFPFIPTATKPHNGKRHVKTRPQTNTREMEGPMQPVIEERADTLITGENSCGRMDVL
uniref:Transposase n=1 Tax=Heterorhabditis bacteriophora TaxID=37862 RepID=A0A1I7XIT0_HETBA